MRFSPSFKDFHIALNLRWPHLKIDSDEKPKDLRTMRFSMISNEMKFKKKKLKSIKLQVQA